MAEDRGLKRLDCTFVDFCYFLLPTFPLHPSVFIAACKPRLYSVDIIAYIVMARMESKGQADVNKAIDAIVSRHQSSLKIVSVISSMKIVSVMQSSIKVTSYHQYIE